jgi:alkanesulfonate monooxygenase SsuD/methylene tetrahydromethanopterin reductase-like flavin-dependent oxidoreductase (luciferase family)
VLGVFRDRAADARPVLVQAPFVLAETDAEAGRLAWAGWRTNAVGSSDTKADIVLPRHFDEAAASVRPSDMLDAVWLVTSAEQLADRIDAVLAAGATRVYLHAIAAPDQFLTGAAKAVDARFSS